MKRLRKFTGVLAAVLCICVCSAALSACKDYVEYEGFLLYYHESYYSIRGITDIDDFSGDVHIPSEYDGLPITTIDLLEFGEESFDNLYIGENITSIPYLSGNFSSVYFPKSLNSIRSFRGNKGMLWLEEGNESFFCRNNCLIQEGEVILAGDNASIPDDGSVTSIGEDAFRNCTGLTSIVIPDSVTSIGSYAFYGCTGLTSIVIPDSVTSIGMDAFEGCTSLTSVTIGSGVTSIGYEAFYGCTELTNIYITDIAAWCGISFNSYWANPLRYAHNLYLNGTLVSELVIPDGVTSIGESAFVGCTSLTSIVIPDSLTSIGEYAFFYCTGLTSVTIGSGVTSIDNKAFMGCTNLKTVYNRSTLEFTKGSTNNGYVAYYAENIYTNS